MLKTMKSTVNERIKALRGAMMLNQNEFATELGLSHSLISKVEAGNEASPKVLDTIIKTYSVPKEWLLQGRGEMAYERPLKAESSPWKDEAYSVIKDQLAKKDVIIDRLTQALLGRSGANFPTALNGTGLRKRSLGAAA